LKNDNKILPLAKDAKIAVVGAHGDSPRLQSGGWTKGWQGCPATMNTYPGATSILAGIKAVSSAPANVSYSATGTLVAGVTAAVIVVGEDPYSEFMGDKAAAALVLPPAQKAYFDTFKNANIPIVMVVVSGRPLIIPDEITKSAAIIAAWLPGSEGAGVADVLFGDYRPTGKLSFSWPKTTAQIPIHFGDATYDPQFPYGFGLTY
jgi:beta-glucosidase